MIAVKLIKGRHYYDRLYKESIIYKVSDEIGVALLSKKNVDGSPRFIRMIPKTKEQEETTPTKRGRGRPKKSETVNKVVDEPPVKAKTEKDTKKRPIVDPLADVVLEGDMDEDYDEEEVVDVEETEDYDPSETESYTHEI